MTPPYPNPGMMLVAGFFTLMLVVLEYVTRRPR